MRNVKRIVGGSLLALLVGGLMYGYLVTERERTYREFVTRGDAALVQDDSSAAIEAFSVAISVKGDSMAAYLKRGEAYRRRNEFEAALRDLRVAARIDPVSPHPLELLGDVQYAMAAEDKGYAPARFARAVERYQEALALDDSEPRVQYKLGLAAYRSGQLPIALQALREAIRLNPRFVEAHYLLGVCLRANGAPREAIRSLERAIELDPAFLRAREELADTYRSVGQREERLVQLEALLALQPSPGRERALALASARAGHLDRAIAQLGRAAQRYPTDGEIFLALGRLWLDRAAGGGSVELEKALRALAAAVNHHNSSEALTLYGRALLMNGEAARAESILREAATRFPVTPQAFLYLADAAARLEHREAARQALLDFAALTLLDEHGVPLLTRIAEAQIEMGNLAEARRALQVALDKDPGNTRLLNLRSRLDSTAGG